MSKIKTIIENEVRLITETPDFIKTKSLGYIKTDSIAFGMFKDQMYISYNDGLIDNILIGADYKGTKITGDNLYQYDNEIFGMFKPRIHNGITKFYHALDKYNLVDVKGRDILGNFELETSDYDYSGRLWYMNKAISFWQYPRTVNVLNTVIGKIEDEINYIYNEVIDLRTFSFEVYGGDYINTFMWLELDYFFDEDLNKNSLMVSYDEFVKILSKGEHTFGQEPVPHILSPMDKNKEELMKSMRKSDIEYLGKKYGKTPIVKYNHVKNTGIAENLNESPDEIEILDLTYFEYDAIAFGMFNNRMYVGYNKNLGRNIIRSEYDMDNIEKIQQDIFEPSDLVTHGDICLFYRLMKDHKLLDIGDRDIFKFNLSSGDFNFSGRLWYDNNIISFWKYPKTVNDLNMVISKLEDEINFIYDEEFDLSTFEFEIYGGDYKDIFMDLERDELYDIHEDSLLVSYNEFVKILNTKKYDLGQEPVQHILSPMDKKMDDTTKNKKQKDIDYLGKKYGKMPIAKYNYVKNTGIAEEINESPDGFNSVEKNVVGAYFSFDAVPFGIYKGEMLVGYNPSLCSSRTKAEFYDHVKQKLEYIKERGIETHIDERDTAKEIVELTSVHPQMFLFTSYLYDRGIVKTNMPAGQYDRLSFSFAGRLWYDKKVISFYKIPKIKSEFILLLSLIEKAMKKTYGYDINFMDFQIDVRLKSGKYNMFNMDEFIDLLDGNTEYNASKEELEKPHLMNFDDKQKSKQMLAAKKANIEYLGKKFGKTPIVKYNFEKNRNIAESMEIMDNIINELVKLKK